MVKKSCISCIYYVKKKTMIKHGWSLKSHSRTLIKGHFGCRGPIVIDSGGDRRGEYLTLELAAKCTHWKGRRKTIEQEFVEKDW